MAIPIKLLGRVESDPMRIPTAASMSQGRDDQFDRLLRDTVASDDAAPTVEQEARAEQPVTDADDIADDPDVELERSARDADVDEPATEGQPEPGEQHAADPEADVTDSIRRGEPERQESAGKGTDSPRTSTPSSEPLIAAKLQSSHVGNSQPNGAVTQAAQQQPAVTRTVEPAIRGASTVAEASNSTPKAQRAHAGYGTRNAASAQMLEQARDSVFKQIMMKLNNDGGEMRLRLQPPELGELDLRLTVEGGNRMSLAIASDQRDMQALLQRHLDELKHTLQQNGLEVTDAEVQTRSEFQRDQERSEEQAGTSSANDQAEDTSSTPQQRGYITAQGLDFWA